MRSISLKQTRLMCFFGLSILSSGGYPEVDAREMREHASGCTRCARVVNQALSEINGRSVKAPSLEVPSLAELLSGRLPQDAA